MAETMIIAQVFKYCWKNSEGAKMEKLKKRKKDPLFAGFLSFFLVGLGQFYNKDWLKGIVFLCGSVSIGILLIILIVLAILAPGEIGISTLVLIASAPFLVWGYSIIEAARRAKAINEGKEDAFPLLALILIELVLLISLCLIIEMVILHPPDLKRAKILRRL